MQLRGFLFHLLRYLIISQVIIEYDEIRRGWQGCLFDPWCPLRADHYSIQSTALSGADSIHKNRIPISSFVWKSISTPLFATHTLYLQHCLIHTPSKQHIPQDKFAICWFTREHYSNPVLGRLAQIPLPQVNMRAKETVFRKIGYTSCNPTRRFPWELLESSSWDRMFIPQLVDAI